MKFRITENHKKLLRRMYVRYNDECEFGAPEIDPKRPYGNSNVYRDMIEIIGLKEIKDGVFEFELNDKKWILKGEDKYNIYLNGPDEEKLCKELDILHESMTDALQLVLLFGVFPTATFEKKNAWSDWEHINDE